MAISDRFDQIMDEPIEEDSIDESEIITGLSDDFYSRSFVFYTNIQDYPIQRATLYNPSTLLFVKFSLVQEDLNLEGPGDYVGKITYGSSNKTNCKAPIVFRNSSPSSVVNKLNKNIDNLLQSGFCILSSEGSTNY